MTHQPDFDGKDSRRTFVWAPAMAVGVAWLGLAIGACDSLLGPDKGDRVSFDQITLGGFHTCGLDASDGQAHCWGFNAYGQIGDGTTHDRTTPVAVDQSVLGGLTFDRIAAGHLHTCGLDTSTGRAYCWGWNEHGQLGVATTSTQTNLVAVDQAVLGGISFDQIAAGSLHTCGLDTSTGQAYCWGDNIYGKLGDASTSNRTTPVAVDQTVLGGTIFDQFAAGIYHACGLDTSTGQAHCWGSNVSGQLGDETRDDRTTPVAVDQSVLGEITFDQIGGGRNHTCGLDASTGRAYCWGANAYGQIGDGTESPRTTPTPVLGTGD